MASEEITKHSKTKKELQVSCVQFAQIEVTEKEQKEPKGIFLEYNGWTIKFGNDANPELVCRIIQTVTDHV